jgi:subfamily B ATP-binding cassette protein MsbA
MSMSDNKKADKKIANAFYIYSRLFVYVKTYWPALVVTIIASMFYSGIDAWFIYFLKPLLNHGLMAKDHQFLKMAPLLVLLIFILRGVSSFVSNYYIALVSRNVIMRLRQDLFAHLQRLPARFYDHTTSGRLLSVILYGVDQVANASADVLTTAIQSIFLIIGLIIVMLSISWKLTSLYFVLIPLVTVIMRLTSLRIRRLSLSIQTSVGEMSHSAEENIEGYKVVRTFSGQEQEIDKFNKITRTNRQREMKVVAARSISTSLIQLITACALALTLYIATMDIGGALLTPGGFVAMVAAMLALLKPMKDLALMQNKLYTGLAGAQRVFELMDEKSEVDTGEISIQKVKGKIEFDQVSFTYDNNKENNKENNKTILDKISFTIEPGQIVALVGKSGSGKSTLVNLLLRFYSYQNGHIYLDDTAISDYQLDNLRRQFAFVSQHVTLFHDTIANNIAYGQPEASLEEIKAAAKAAYATEFIDNLPGQFDALIGENGILLSGGQRQRIAIARAILKKAPILILDEATSALDTESERSIQLALDELMKTRTTLVIAHRLSTIEHADKIIVMDEGRIIETGNHYALLAANGQYAKLYHMQFKSEVTAHVV